MRLAVAIALIAAAWAGLLLEVDPVPTWFYVFAWYPTLLLLDELAHRIDGRARLLSDWARIGSLFGWSAVIWLVFEAANFRLTNWYYVFLPDGQVERWAGILLSFATVVPALVLMARVLDAIGGTRTLRSGPLPLPERQRWIPVALGLLMLGLTFTWPETFFPLVWGALWLLLEPFVYWKRPDLSLFADLTRGAWERTARLLVAGFLVGVMWESLNFWARGKWIYTVPWLEQLKLFEMPPVGFLGFPFFALEAWTMYAALVAIGVAAPVRMTHERHDTEVLRVRPTSTFRAFTLAAAGIFCVAVLLGMDLWTTSSTVPALSDVPSVERYENDLRAFGIETPFALARTPAALLSRHPDMTPERSIMLTETAKLVTLRGLGTVHARRLRDLGIFTQCRLARADAPTLWSAYHDRPLTHDPPTVTPPERPTPAEVRVWVRSAVRACSRELRDEP